MQTQDYTPSQIESALATVYGVDTQLIADGTYFVADESMRARATRPRRQLLRQAARSSAAAAGANEKRSMAATNGPAARPPCSIPQHDAAKIRAFFIHPSWARRGIGTMILEACENAALAAGFTRFEMGATLTGVPLYQARGYVALENLEVPLANGESLPIVRMEKRVPQQPV